MARLVYRKKIIKHTQNATTGQYVATLIRYIYMYFAQCDQIAVENITEAN